MNESGTIRWHFVILVCREGGEGGGLQSRYYVSMKAIFMSGYSIFCSQKAVKSFAKEDWNKASVWDFHTVWEYIREGRYMLPNESTLSHVKSTSLTYRGYFIRYVTSIYDE